MKKTGSIIYAAATILFILIAALSFTGTVMSRTGFTNEEMEGYYRECENRMVGKTRDLLDAKGYTNSGIMMTRVVEANGSRIYTLTVHHGDIDALCDYEKNNLADELLKLAFQDENCTFYQEFLCNE